MLTTVTCPSQACQSRYDEELDGCSEEGGVFFRLGNSGVLQLPCAAGRVVHVEEERKRAP